MKRTLLAFGVLCVVILLVGQGCVSLRRGGETTTAGPAGMFISFDKGDAWQPIAQLPTVEGVRDLSAVSVYRLFSDPEDPNALYWASRAHGFFYSYNAGKEWRQGAEALAKNFIYSIAVHPKNKCTIYVTTGDRIYKSTDCSRSWEEVYVEARTDGTHVMSLVVPPFAPYDIYAAESNGDILRSRDQGKSWQVLARLGEALDVMEADPLRDRTLYLASRRGGLFRSLDGGETWQNMNEGLQTFSGSLEYRRFLIQPRGSENVALYWVSTYGILRSDDRGKTWTAYNLITPPGSVQIYGFAVNQHNPNEMFYTATINNRSTFYRTVDNGQNWTTRKLPSGQVPTMLFFHTDKNKQFLYLGFTVPPRT